MKRRILISVGVFFAVVVLLVSWAQVKTSQAAEKGVTLPPDLKGLQIGGGSVGGLFNVAASTMAKYLEKELKIPVSAIVSRGALDNLTRLISREIPLGLAGTNSGVPSYLGLEDFGYRPAQPDLRAIMGIHNNLWSLHVRRDSPWNSISDLKGSGARVGNPPYRLPKWAKTSVSTIHYELHGLEIGKDIKLVYLGIGDMFNNFAEGRLDACWQTTGGGHILFPAYVDASSRIPMKMLTIGKQAIDKYIKICPWGKEYNLTIDGQTIQTYDNGGPQLYTTVDMPEDLAYLIAKILYENLDKMAEEARIFQYTREVMTEQAGVPYHPGAIKYWKEVGQWKDK